MRRDIGLRVRPHARTVPDALRLREGVRAPLEGLHVLAREARVRHTPLLVLRRVRRVRPRAMHCVRSEVSAAHVIKHRTNARRFRGASDATVRLLGSVH